MGDIAVAEVAADRVQAYIAGVDINTVRAWLGHVSLDTTNIYAEIDLETKAKALAKCDVGDASKPKPRWRDDPGVMAFLRSL